MHGNDFLLGWLLVRPSPRADEYMDARLPDRIISASSCICEVHPVYDDLAELDCWEFLKQRSTNDRSGNYYFLDSAESAQEMNSRWFGGELEVLALAMRPNAVSRLDAEIQRLMAGSNKHLPAYVYAPLKPQAFTGREQLIGYEVLGYLGGCSYLCSGLEKELLDEFGGSFTPDGLIADGDLAELFAEHINEHELGEPHLYLSYAFYRMA